MISVKSVFLILVCVVTHVNGICDSQTGPVESIECSLGNNFNKKQWNTCLSNTYIQQQSQGRHRCGDETVKYCNYPCMHEVYYLEGELVIDPCFCNDSSVPPASTLPIECLSPDGSSCDWYKNCLERKYSCQGTPTEHVLTYATTFCELYTKHKDIFSDRAQRWIDDARKCLQVALVPFVRPFINGNCQKIRDKAFTSYKPCYLRPYPEVASICHMTRRDWLRVFWTLKSAFIASTPIAYSSLQNAIDTFNECSMDTEANDFGHIFKEFKLTIDLIQTSWDNLNKDQSDQIAVRIAHQIAQIVLASPKRWGWYAYGIPLSTQRSRSGYKQIAIELLVADLPGIVNETLVPPVNITNIEFNEIITRLENAVIKGDLQIQTENGKFYVSQMSYCLDMKCYATTENILAPPYVPKNGSSSAQTCRGALSYDQCSSNPACGCLPQTTIDNGSICAYLHVKCSELMSCANNNQTCYRPDHVCVNHPRCHSAPLCYPADMALQLLCPPTTTIRPPPVVPNDSIYASGTWNQNEVTM